MNHDDLSNGAPDPLSHAKDGVDPTCSDCVHCLPGPNTPNDILSRCCYRFPPTAMIAQTPQGVAVITFRPEVRTDTTACGEFETAEDDPLPFVVPADGSTVLDRTCPVTRRPCGAQPVCQKKCAAEDFD